MIFMLIKKNKLKEINKNKVNKVQMGQAAKQEKNIILEAWVERGAGCLSTQ